MLRSTKKKIVTAVVALVLGLALGYLFFGSSGSSNEQGVKGKVTSEDTVIKIGVMMPLTGDTAVYGVGVKNAVEMAVAEINANKMLQGKQIQLVIEDSKCLPKDASTSVNKLISEDHVLAIVGELCSSATLAAAPVAEASQTVMISPASTSPKITDAGDYIFRDIPSDALQGVVGADLVYTSGYRNVALLYINNEYGVGLKDVFKNRFLSVDGEVITEETFEQGATDFRTQLTKINDAAPDAIYLVALPAEAGLLLKQAAELGMNIPFIGTEGMKDPSVIEVAKEAAEGLVLTTPKPNSDAHNQAFVTNYKQQYGSEPALFAAEGYDAMQLLALAIKNSDGSHQGVKDALYQIKSYLGASGTITINNKGEVEKPYSYFKVENGKFEEYSI